MAAPGISHIMNGYVLERFILHIEKLDLFLQTNRNLSVAELSDYYQRVHAATTSCLGHESSGIDCPVTQCFKTAAKKLPSIVFMRLVNERPLRTVRDIDQIYRIVRQMFGSISEESGLYDYYKAVRGKVETLSFFDQLQRQKPKTIAHVAQIFVQVLERSLERGDAFSSLSAAWMRICDKFDHKQELDALDRQTAEESFGKYDPLKLTARRRPFIETAIESVRATTSFSFPVIDIREDVSPTNLYEKEELDMAQRLAEDSLDDEADEWHIGMGREELNLLGLIELDAPQAQDREVRADYTDFEDLPKMMGLTQPMIVEQEPVVQESALIEIEVREQAMLGLIQPEAAAPKKKLNTSNLPDAILEGLIGELVLDLNAIYAKRTQRAAQGKAADAE